MGLVCGALRPAQASVPRVVINEVYGGGGNLGAPYKNDFIELFNNGTLPVDLSGWSLQYASATGTSWANKTNLFGTIPAKGYFLIQLAAGTGMGVDLPSPDVTANISMSSTAAKVALVNNTTVIDGNLTNANLSSYTNIVDLVGFGPTASVYEGSGPTSSPSNTTSVSRTSIGVDNNSNNTDFSVGAPTPLNSSNVFPTANAQSVATNKNTAAAITLTATGSGTLTYANTNPTHGTLTGTAPDLTYTPTTGYTGADSFTFTASNSAGTSTAATVSITVVQTTETPSTIVTTTSDSSTDTDGLISLREAIGYANAGDEVTFNIPDDQKADGKWTIALGSGLSLNKNLTITGPGANLLTLSSTSSSDTVITVSATATLSGFTTQGGGYGIVNYGTVTATNCTFSNSINQNFDNLGTSTATLTGCTFRGSSTTFDGVNNDVAATVTVKNCTFTNNTNAGFHNNGSATVVNSTFVGNGCALLNADLYNARGPATVTNCTLSGNSVGILSLFKQITVQNSLIAGNGSTLTLNGNAISYNNITSGTAAEAGLEVNENGAAVLKDNGGPTQTIALVSATGTAVNAGANSLIPAGITTDQRGTGYSRKKAGTVDIGAYESDFTSPDTPSTIVTTTSDVVDSTDGLISLREAIGYASAGGEVTFAIPEEQKADDKWTLTLASDLAIDKNLTLTGPGAKLLTIKGDDVRLLTVNENVTSSISGLTFGQCQTGFTNWGTTVLSNCTFSGASNGIDNEDTGDLTVTGSTFTGCGNKHCGAVM